MPKILQICVEGNTGSTGSIAEAIGAYVLAHNWESYIAFGRFPRPSVSKIIRIGSDWETMMHGVETRIFDRHGLGSRKATKELIAKIQLIQPDIIQLHHLHGYYINIEILFEYLLKSNIPVVWIFHDCWSFTGHCGFFDYVKCDKWKTVCNDCPQKNEYPKSFFIDGSERNFYIKRKLFTSIPNLTIVSVSRWLDNLVSESFFKYSRHTWIHNGIDLETFKPSNNRVSIRQKYSLGDKFLVLGVATTWDRRKGLKDFIELSRFLKQDIALVLVGLNKNQIKLLPNNIMGISRTDDREELVNLYSVAGVFLNLSDEESFGLTTAEAMACGTPVVVYNKTASPELVSNETGIIIEKGDFQSLIKAIDTIKSKGKEHYTDMCRNYAEKKFNMKDRFEDYLKLYREILNSTK